MTVELVLFVAALTSFIAATVAVVVGHRSVSEEVGEQRVDTRRSVAAGEEQERDAPLSHKPDSRASLDRDVVPGEAETLERLILEKLQAAEPEADLQAEKAFLKYRYSLYLRRYRKWHSWYAAPFLSATLIIVAGGLISAAIGAAWDSTQWARITFLELTLAIYLLAGLRLFWGTGQKLSGRASIVNRLTAEGWAFIEGTGRYADSTDVRTAFTFFVEEVERAASDATAARDDAEADVPQSVRRERP